MFAPVDVAIPLLRVAGNESAAHALEALLARGVIHADERVRITGDEVYVCGDFEEQRVIRP